MTASSGNRDDHYVEQVVLGNLMVHPDTYSVIRAALLTSDFQNETHRLIYETISALHGEKDPFDAVAIAAEFTRREELDKIGGAEYLKQLINTTSDSQAPSIQECIQSITKLTAARESGYWLAELLPGAIDSIEAIGRSKYGPHVGVPTGFSGLDAPLNGLRPGLVHLLIGYTGTGVSTLALNMARAASIYHGLTTLVFSGQSPRNEVLNRILSAEGRVASHAMRTGTMQDEDWMNLGRRIPEIANAPLLIDDSSGLSSADLRAKSKRTLDKHELALIVIDGVNLYARQTAPESLWAAQTRLSADIKRLAMELRVPVVMTAPTNRRADNRLDPRPTLPDVASSSAYSADADIVIGVHRPDLGEVEHPRAGEADLIVLKNRYGPSFTTTVAFQGHYHRFVDMAF